MALTPERKAQLYAELDKIIGLTALPRPKVVTQDGVTIRDADVQVSRADPNARGADRIVEVRRDDWVTVNFEEYGRQQADRAAERRYRRQLDPCRLGLYGPIDDDE